MVVDIFDELMIKGDEETKQKIQNIRRMQARMEELKANCPLKRFLEGTKKPPKPKMKILPPTPDELLEWSRQELD